jgi:hypothetical protein
MTMFYFLRVEVDLIMTRTIDDREFRMVGVSHGSRILIPAKFPLGTRAYRLQV